MKNAKLVQPPDLLWATPVGNSCGQLLWATCPQLANQERKSALLGRIERVFGDF